MEMVAASAAPAAPSALNVFVAPQFWGHGYPDMQDMEELFVEQDLPVSRSCSAKKESHSASTSTSSKRYAVLAEQGRRKRMKMLCAKLSSLLPNTTSETNRCKLYEEAMKHIRDLEEELKVLKAKRNSLAFASQLAQKCPTTKTLVSVDFFGRQGIVSLQSLRKPASLSAILQRVEEHQLDVDTFQIYSWDPMVSCSLYVTPRPQVLHDLATTKASLERTLTLIY